MNCPKCHKEVEQTFQTDIGTMCRDCVFTAAAYVPEELKRCEHGIVPAAKCPHCYPVPITQMDLLKSVGATRPDYFFGPGKGSFTCEPHQATEEQMRFNGKTLPIRQLKCYYLKAAAKFDKSIGHFELLHAESFSCS